MIRRLAATWVIIAVGVAAAAAVVPEIHIKAGRA